MNKALNCSNRKFKNEQFSSHFLPTNAPLSRDNLSNLYDAVKFERNNKDYATIAKLFDAKPPFNSQDQMLIQKSVSEFVSSRPNKAKELGITVDSSNSRLRREINNIANADSDSDSETVPRRSKTRKITDDDEDDDFIPDKFESLVNSKKRKKEEKPEPVIVKPKLKRVEKKFVPVLEKLSINEITEINTYQQFNRTLDHVMKSAEDIDFSEMSTLSCCRYKPYNHIVIRSCR